MKKSNIILILVLVLLAISAYFLTKRSGETSSDITERIMLADIDTNQITKIFIKNEFDSITLERDGESWLVTKPFRYRSDEDRISIAMMRLADLSVISSVSNKREKLHKFGLDSTGIIVKIYGKQGIISDLIIGNNASNPTEVFARLNGSDEVYLVKGPLRFTFNAPLKDWRNRRIVRFNPDTVTSISLNYGKESFTLNKKDSLWYISGIQADSSFVNKYLRRLTIFDTDYFEDDYDSSGFKQTHSISLNGYQLLSVQQVDKEQYIVTSPQSKQWFTLLRMKAILLLPDKKEFLGEE
jgi:hypothetical protein